ncbi:hypothetical protein GDO78_018249 [Eleutherodactylus coqui]|uniref:Uncharacterized protein n=1 Tax=Eleutherodactylus coqui TaxID=57060 RepID=A0A8J6E5P7_ELECQ|nr:hypothetical protein GDO78_018249 [Eleutherodactylus coqui]
MGSTCLHRKAETPTRSTFICSNNGADCPLRRIRTNIKNMHLCFIKKQVRMAQHVVPSHPVKGRKPCWKLNRPNCSQCVLSAPFGLVIRRLHLSTGFRLFPLSQWSWTTEVNEPSRYFTLSEMVRIFCC